MADHSERERNKARKRVNNHMSRYLKSGGEDGHIWGGAPTLLLTTIGRESGNPNTTPLIYGRDGNHYILVASRSGAPRNPGWYRNLSKTPDVEIQIKTWHVPARARTATPEEKPISLKKAVIASRINTLLSLPMLLSMVAAQNLY